MLADLAGREVGGGRVRPVRRPRPATEREPRRDAAGGLTALVDAAVTEAPGGVVYGASFENHPALVARLAERHTLLGNRPETLRAVRDPARLGAALGRRPPVPADDRHAPAASGRWLRKPLRGGGGIRVREWRGGALPAGTFLQERIDGLPCSAAAVGDGKDAVVLGLTEQLVGRRAFGVRGYRWCGNLVPPRVPAGERTRCSARRARSAPAWRARSRLRGLFGVDFIWDGERAWTVEVNPRPTASLEAIEAAYGVACSTRTCEAAPASCRASSPSRARPARRSCSPPRTSSIGDSERWLERGVRDVPHPGERIAAGRPICTVVATAATPQDALAGLEEQAARLRAELRVEVAAGG